ncbi:MAG: hypothetical protein J6Q27_00720 [Clostridia bacterium]|nr:hypothetical protein [Clostridia bacterium]
MYDDFAVDVYNSLNGYYKKEYMVSGVESIFEEGMECMQLYTDMLAAYERLRNRLGVIDEDRDVEEMITALLCICEKVGLQMYHYGKIFADQK